ncbi:hypothetical protein Tco_0163912 [Tanacetum coccineum]
MVKYSQKWYNGTSKTRSIETSDGLAAIQAQLNNLERELKKVNEKERGFGSLPNSAETNLRDHVKSILTTVEADTSPIRRIGSSQYDVSAQQNRNLTFKSRQATILFLSRLNDYYCDDKGSYGPQYLDAYSCGATRLNDSLPRKEKDRGSIVSLTGNGAKNLMCCRVGYLHGYAYGRRWIRRIGNCEYAFSCEDLVLIRRIYFPGYGVLVRFKEFDLLKRDQQVVSELVKKNLFLLKDMDQDSAHMVAASKVPMLNLENGATLPKTKIVEGVLIELPITSAKEKAQRRLEVKARNLSGCTTKRLRNLLKQQYENFTAPSSEMLDQTFDRLQKHVSQLELLDEKLSQEDVNQKLLRSLSPEWNTQAVVWRNKADLDTMSMNDLYNNPKVYEPEVKWMSSSS